MRVGKVLWVLFKTTVFTALVPGTVGFWVPYRIRQGTRAPDVLIASASEVGLSYFLLIAGAAIYLWCAWDFSVKGMGTPAPIDAPKNLVINGLYRFVRNPMYLGVSCMILSQALVGWSLEILFYLALVVIAFNLFVRLYEEPHLRKIFGEQYLEYCRRVPRWTPRFRPVQ